MRCPLYNIKKRTENNPFLCLERDEADIHPSVINLHVGHCWTGWVDITKSHVHVHSATGCKEGQ